MDNSVVFVVTCLWICRATLCDSPLHHFDCYKSQITKFHLIFTIFNLTAFISGYLVCIYYMCSYRFVQMNKI